MSSLIKKTASTDGQTTYDIVDEEFHRALNDVIYNYTKDLYTDFESVEDDVATLTETVETLSNSNDTYMAMVRESFSEHEQGVVGIRDSLYDEITTVSTDLGSSVSDMEQTLEKVTRDLDEATTSLASLEEEVKTLKRRLDEMGKPPKEDAKKRKK